MYCRVVQAHARQRHFIIISLALNRAVDASFAGNHTALGKMAIGNGVPGIFPGVLPIVPARPKSSIWHGLTLWLNRTRALPPSQRGELVLFDRHVEKNGGAAMSGAMTQSGCPPVGIGLYVHNLVRINYLLRNNSRVVCVDAHAPVPDEWLTIARNLPARRVVIMLRVRRPPEHYVSFYQWGVPRRYAFATWFPGDLQSHILLHSHAGARAHLGDHGLPPLGETSCRARALPLARAVDVLSTTEGMNASWRALRALTGLALPALHVGHPERFSSGQARATAVNGSSSGVPPWPMVEQLSWERARCDWALYEEAQRRELAFVMASRRDDKTPYAR